MCIVKIQNDWIICIFPRLWFLFFFNLQIRRNGRRKNQQVAPKQSPRKKRKLLVKWDSVLKSLYYSWHFIPKLSYLFICMEVMTNQLYSKNLNEKCTLLLNRFVAIILYAYMYNIHKLIDDIFQKKSHFLQMRRKTHPLVTKVGCSLGVKDCLMTVRRMRSGLITKDSQYIKTQLPV